MTEEERQEGLEAEPVTARDDEGEPGGEEDAANEAERDPNPEPEEPAEEEEDPLAGLQRERDEYLELAQRTQADFENCRKRAAKEAAVAGEADDRVVGARGHRADGEKVGLLPLIAPRTDHVPAKEVAGFVRDHARKLRLVPHAQKQACEDYREARWEHHRVEIRAC